MSDTHDQGSKAPGTLEGYPVPPAMTPAGRSPSGAYATRRDFLAGAAIGAATIGAAALGLPSLALAQPKGAGAPGKPGVKGHPVFPPSAAAETRFAAKGTVVRVTKPGALGGGNIPSRETARQMVDRAVMELTGTSKPESAWAQFAQATDKVLIKPNAFGFPAMAAHPETAWSIVDSLKAVGVPEENIIIYDQMSGRMMAARYKLTMAKASGVRVLSNKQAPYETQFRKTPAGRTQLALPVLWASVIIDLAVIKTHDLSGVTCAMKNLTHGVVVNPGAFHRDGCAGIPHVWALPEIKDKVKLIITDGFKLLWDGGPHDKPRFKVPFDSMFATTDPVAMDRLAWEYVDEVRKAKGKQTLAAIGRPPKFIEAAAAMGLGTAARDQIKVVETKV
jgi:uncharacterized protein (DUF362 family)